MRIFGLEIARASKVKSAMVGAYGGGSGFWNLITEPFAGAWQKNIVAESRQNLLAFSAVYSCVSLIAADISKLRPMLTQLRDDGTWQEVDRFSPKARPLVKPNPYQTRIQFYNSWIVSKLLHGNTYVLKQRDVRGVVTSQYVLDPRLVKPLVADDGAVYYQLNRDTLSGLEDITTVPASEIIHDRCMTPFHPLCGVSPVYACAASATQGIRIQANSATFFENMSRPSGQLFAPGTITDEVANRLKREFEANFGGAKIGRIFVGGDGLKFEAITMPAVDAQLIEQLRWTVEDVARCFHMPLHKIAAGQDAKFANMAALNQDYYSQTLQEHIEAIEVLEDEGLELAADMDVEFDLEGLMRMDPISRADRASKLVTAGIWAPNEARFVENDQPVDGGDTPYMQQQMWPLRQLAKRPLPTDTAPTPPALPPPDANMPPPKDATAAIERLEVALAERAAAMETLPATVSELVATRVKEAMDGLRPPDEDDESADLDALAERLIERFQQAA